MQAMDAQRITLSMTDRSAGYDSHPGRVRLAALADFSREVGEFLAGEAREVDPASLDVAVIAGSLAIRTEPIAAAPTLFRDLRLLASGPLLGGLDGKRRKVLEQWQKRARKTTGLSFRIAAPFLDHDVEVHASTDFHADDADQWVRVERYVHGEVTDLGGVGQPNAHVRLPGGKVLRVGADRATLQVDQQNRLYKPAMLRVRAEYNLLTHELRNAQLIEFVEYAPRFDEQAFDRQTRRGAQAWKDVADASGWVDELRGDAS